MALGAMTHEAPAIIQEKAVAIAEKLKTSVQSGTPVKTGALRDSITASVESGGIAKVSTDLPYAPIIEANTHFMTQGVEKANIAPELDATLEAIIEVAK
jgi:hypothetical protein